MQFKPSPQTTKRLKRGAWLFLPLWCGTGAFIWLSSEGLVPKTWNTPIFVGLSLLFAVYFAHALAAFASAADDLQKSQHGDPDVAALIDEEIDITTYRLRKEVDQATHGRRSTPQA